MEHIYVLRGTNTKKKYFKVGLHTGTKKKLYERYRTYMIEPDILRFYISDDSKQDEKEIFVKIEKYRIDRIKSKSEWVKMDKNKLLKITDKHFGEFTKSCF